MKKIQGKPMTKIKVNDIIKKRESKVMRVRNV
jgi:hypothetical protein